MFYVERLKRVNAKSVVVSSAKNMKSLISLSGRELDDLKKAEGFVNEKLVPASEKAVKVFGKVLKNTGEDLKGLIRQEEVVTDKGFGFSVGNNIKFSDVVSDFKSGVNDVKDNFVKAIKSGDDKATGTVWDYIKVTPSKDGLHSTYYEESAIPRSLEKEISTNGIVYDKLRTSGNWEFKFAKPREEGQLPVIKHAQFNGWGR